MVPDYKPKNFQAIELHIAQSMSPDTSDMSAIDQMDETVAVAIAHVTHFVSSASVVRGPSV